MNQWNFTREEEPGNNTYVDVMDIRNDFGVVVVHDVLYINGEWLDADGNEITVSPEMWRKV